MRATHLKKKYPELWDNIENAVKQDIKAIKIMEPSVIAYNAAFEACLYFDKYLNRESIPV